MVDARAVLSVTLVGLLCAAVLAGTHELTAARIKLNESARFRGELEKLLGAAIPDAVTASPAWERDVWRLCDGYALARVKTPGYAGPIEVLVASASGARAFVSGVAVSSHTETPGIVDFLHTGSPWLADQLPEPLQAQQTENPRRNRSHDRTRWLRLCVHTG